MALILHIRIHLILLDRYQMQLGFLNDSSRIFWYSYDNIFTNGIELWIGARFYKGWGYKQCVGTHYFK